MERVVQHAAKYLGAVIGFLVILALYFFFKMNQSLSADQSYIDEIVEENQTLVSKSAELESKLSAFSKQVAELEEDLSNKTSTIEQIQQQNGGDDLIAKCSSLPPSDELVSVKNKLEKSRERQQSCSISLGERDDEIRALKSSVRELRDASNSSEDIAAATRALRDELAELREENERLLAQTSNDDDASQALEEAKARNIELTNQLNELQSEIAKLQQSSNTSDLESQLALVNAENARLQSLLNNSQGKPEEEKEEESALSSELQLVKFESKPNYCRITYPDGSRCVASVDVVATFNFRPGGFIAMKALDPDGNTIDRQSIAGRPETRFTIEFDSDERTAPGVYSVELSNNDVLNPLKVRETFTIDSL